jgi:hypothetical protein
MALMHRTARGASTATTSPAAGAAEEGDTALVRCLHRWADITAGACTPAEVEECCGRFETLLAPRRAALQQQQQQRGRQGEGGASAKLLLRRLWYRLQAGGVVAGEEVYIYMLAG